MRIDKLLWFLRLAKSRKLAQQLAETGHIRRNGDRVDRAAQAVTVGDVLTVPLGARVVVIRVQALPVRRGPAPEAQACYVRLDTPAVLKPEETLDAPASSPLAGRDYELPEGSAAP
ncbi:RNA-binding S4 domain-containing protein [Novosphingobium sp.]|uniref:RNA-binding S4 domain-containing protein n=1 Tax=Novosphingobium sp. TaxID=1874826 RepID=UPI0025CED412|nr:RNA-binding S4 domain-containing protein [Novosphingobium sp.]